MISKEALEEFKQIWRKEHQGDISDAEAMEQATKLLTLMSVIYKPIKKEWIEEKKPTKGTSVE